MLLLLNYRPSRLSYIRSGSMLSISHPRAQPSESSEGRPISVSTSPEGSVQEVRQNKGLEGEGKYFFAPAPPM